MTSKSLVPAILLTSLLFTGGCRSRHSVEVIDLNKVLDIYDQVVTSREDPEKKESDQLSANETSAEDTQEFLKLFAAKLNEARLIKSYIGVDMQASGMIRGFVDRDKNGTKSTNNSQEPLLFTIEFDPDANRVIATQMVAGQQYRRDHRYGSNYYRYYFYHRMHNSMWHRQNSYYSPSRPRPNYSGFAMSNPNYHSGAVSRARSVARTSSRSSRRSSSARGFGRSGSFSGGK